MIAGMTGLMDLVAKVVKHSNPLWHLTEVYFLCLGIGLLVSLPSIGRYLVDKMSGNEVETRNEVETGCDWPEIAMGYERTLAYVLALSAVYSDWCLAIMLDNLVGVPSSDNLVFYWTYFVAKRLAMLSW
jgi:hypothetical protein